MNKNDGKNPKGDDLTEEDLALAADQVDEEDDDNEDVSPASSDSEEDGTPETLVTKEGLQALKDELEEIETVRRKEVAARLKEAISFGDLSENSEYEDAKNEQAMIEQRAAELRGMIKTAKIITEKKSSGAVKIGSTVTIQNLTDKDDPETYTIVGSTEADPMAAKISNESPIGAAVLDKSKGDEVVVQTPSGELKYKITKVA